MKIFSILIFLIISSALHAKDMREYMRETADLIEMNEYEEALERTIWFHNHALEHRPGLYGVRLSFELSRWHEFGKKYPPALAALKDIRDKKTNIIKSGEGTRNLFHDVSSINRTLSDDNKTVDLFKYLHKNQPKLAKDVWRISKDTLIKENEYSIVREYI
ncbi:MAG: hypothetical protein KZQ85_02520 [Candidatus Thiodiazotropha sp. (ex Myrtea sp. 'scaly one' KF741663)]|nr:hypothetical protein [Candidatus Thiodiazotropha sp. (ex Myrtea sp. 'scaly one' KF741663)]